MADIFPDRLLALAGLAQATGLAQGLARRNQADEEAWRASIGSVLAVEASSTEVVFGGIPGLRLGLTALRDRVGGPPTPETVELIRYMAMLMKLAAQLRRRGDMLKRLGEGLREARETYGDELERAGTVPAELVEHLAALYQETISTLKPRIMVSGEHGHLNNPIVAARVRAVLLAGIRAAFLWLQLGGRRWQLPFQRNRIVRDATLLLQRTTH